MKTKSKLAAMAGAAAVLVLLAGCTETLKAEEQAKQIVSRTTESLGQAVSDTVDAHVGKLKKEGASRSLSATEPAGRATGIRLENEVGNIAIRAAEGSDLEIEAEIWSANKLANRDVLTEVFDQAEISVTTEGNEMYIAVHAKDDPDMNLWKWAQKKYRFSDFSIDYTLGLPESIVSYDVTSQVGDVAMTGLQGSYRVRSEVGSVQLSDAGIAGASSISASTGSIELGIARMEEAADLQVEAEIGSIEAKLADSLNCEVEAKAELGEISGVPDGRSRRGSGGPLLSLNASVGAITVQ
ncbi:hypothetical protein LBW89_23875 [Paenibacillus sp. alder61]|uniref:DUF4097 domain-containing protein n=1 Tax=Paenibacillus faecis TaxID=862114 RepID=A0A5D0CLY0_9BACL|nr:MULTISPECIES: hypothetical protein [Paenibacillus]MCA1296050.1 hypothetical protein [Paenibacillus sp. alder61]TYA10871.1 hypothetical protein FRY98_24165 [Paenibacillus faecis]